jgi:Tfp pilus assembly protein PilV
VHRSVAAQSGTSLAETLIALSILAGGLLALGQLFIISGRMLQRANELSTAAVLAADKLETLRGVARGAGDVTGDGADFVDAAGQVLTAGGSAAAAFTRQWSIRPLSADPDVRIVHLHVMPGRPQGPVTADATPRLAGEVMIVTAYARDVP